MIHLDTSVLIDALTGTRRSMPALRSIVADGIRIGVSTLVLYEWRRGRRTPDELAIEAALIAPEAVVPFGAETAQLAATLYQRVKRPRGREIDLAIAACALHQQALLWTVNRPDFSDIPGLTLHRP
jgi:predicted nucleic acid-binding protein